MGVTANVAKVISEVKSAKRQLAETEIHYQTMDASAIRKIGSGLYFKRYRYGYA